MPKNKLSCKCFRFGHRLHSKWIFEASRSFSTNVVSVIYKGRVKPRVIYFQKITLTQRRKNFFAKLSSF